MRKMILQASMSRSEILVHCSYPFGREVEEEEPEDKVAANYGSGFHELMAAAIDPQAKVVVPVALVAKRWGIDDPDALKLHVDASFKYITTWLKGENPYKARWTGPRLVEKALALLPGKTAIEISKHDDTHHYDVPDGYLPGTGDLFAEAAMGTTDPILVLDHKTSEIEDFSSPLEKEQLLSLAAALMRWKKRTSAVVAVLHSRRLGMPKIYAEKVTLKDLRDHEKKLAVGLGRIGEGSLNPGPWCKYCPGRTICPAKDAELLENAGTTLALLNEAAVVTGEIIPGADDSRFNMVPAPKASLSTEQKLGLLYLVVQQAETLAERVRSEMRAALVNAAASGTPLLPETPDGRVLVLRESERSNLSQASVVRAMGKLEGGKMLAKLRAAGAIETKKVVSLSLEKNDRAR